MLAIFTAVAGAILGSMPDLFAGVPSTLDFRIRLWVAIAATVVGLAVLVYYFWLTRRQNMLFAERGTSYVVDSPAETWTQEEKRVYLAGAAREFAAVIQVPGPTGLSNWRWPLREGAERWSDAVDDLVLSFRSVHANDDGDTPNSIVCWAMYPVAVGWAARARSADRNLKLAIRQRPSAGRAGPIDIPDWKQPPHTFDSVKLEERLGEVRPVRMVRLALSDSVDGSVHSAPGLAGKSSVVAPDTEEMAPTQSKVLLIRLNGADWNGFKPGEDGPARIDLLNRTGARISIAESAEFHEWRCLSVAGKHVWDDYPRLTTEIVEWIAQTADPTGMNFIGMLAPQEIQLGIGIQVARRQRHEWPAHLWPLMKPYGEHALTIPGIDLGWESLTLIHLNGPRG